jgi:hypothetical protein
MAFGQIRTPFPEQAMLMDAVNVALAAVRCVGQRNDVVSEAERAQSVTFASKWDAIVRAIRLQGLKKVVNEDIEEYARHGAALCDSLTHWERCGDVAVQSGCARAFRIEIMDHAPHLAADAFSMKLEEEARVPNDVVCLLNIKEEGVRMVIGHLAVVQERGDDENGVQSPAARAEGKLVVV